MAVQRRLFFGAEWQVRLVEDIFPPVQAGLPERSFGSGAKTWDMAKSMFEHGFQENKVSAFRQGVREIATFIVL